VTRDLDLERAERDGYRAVFEAAPPEAAAAVGLATRSVSGACCIACRGVETTMLNRVTGLGLEREATEADLDVIDAFFREQGVRYAIGLPPAARPADLERRLLARGFERGYAWMKFRRGVEPPPPVETDLRVERVGPDRGADVARVVVEAYAMPEGLAAWWTGVPGAPGVHCFVAYDGAEPAAAALLFTSGRTGWLGGAGARPDFRRRGGQGAVLAARIRAAADLGLETLTTETGERVPDRPSNSYRNILRFGFEEAYLRPNLVSPA
jgi:hypothetical protein